MSLQHQIALTQLKGIGPKIARNLIQYFGDAESVFKAGVQKIIQIDGIAHKTADIIVNGRDEALQKAEEQLLFIEKHHIEVLLYEDAKYPQRLKNCHDSPLLLYYKGNVDLNQKRIINIVGTRNATSYGKMICAQLVEESKAYNILIVSGLAHGIDAAAHKECVNQQVPTIGVLGHGLDRIYPAAHRDLAAKMLKNGGLITEFPAGTFPARENFPQRNRIIAGMADVTIVVEASIKGGALITAEIANSYNRDVYAFPGRINDEFSEGCNFLIKTNRAGLINHPRDLIYYLGWDDQPKEKKPVRQVQLPLDLSADERKIMELISENALGVDDLAIQTNLPQSILAMNLLSMEMKGLIVTLPGKCYTIA